MAFAQARQKAGLSQAQVAKELGVDQSAVCRWETGENMPRAATLQIPKPSPSGEGAAAAADEGKANEAALLIHHS